MEVKEHVIGGACDEEKGALWVAHTTKDRLARDFVWGALVCPCICHGEGKLFWNSAFQHNIKLTIPGQNMSVTESNARTSGSIALASGVMCTVLSMLVGQTGEQLLKEIANLN